MKSAVSGARFLTGGVFECDIAHRLSVAVLCMLYKIRCNLMHRLTGALPEPYVPVPVTRGALVAHRNTFAPSRCRTSKYRRTFVLLSVSLWNDLAVRWCGTGGFQEQGQCFFIGLSCSIPTIVFYYFSLSLLSVYRLILWEIYVFFNPLKKSDSNKIKFMVFNEICDIFCLINSNSQFLFYVSFASNQEGSSRKMPQLDAMEKTKPMSQTTIHVERFRILMSVIKTKTTKSDENGYETKKCLRSDSTKITTIELGNAYRSHTIIYFDL